jgi:hypothetical protein
VNGTFREEDLRRRVVAIAAPEIDAGTFAVTRLGITPDVKQMCVLRSEAKRGILNCSRQWGKSTVAAVKAVHRVYTRPGSTVLVSSPCVRQSAEFLRKASELLVKLDIKPKGDGDNAVSLMLPSGSRIVGLPGRETTTRGFSAVSMLLFDEASRVSDEVYQALRPSLAVGGGDLWLMSTPCGQRGFFYEAWVSQEKWFRMSAKITECARIEAEFIEEERREKTADCFAQEYLCEFTASDDAVFDRRLVEAAMDDSVSELQIIGRR